jgi:hypothetical protein
MKKQSIPRSKLRLDTQTVRRLDDLALASAAGGAFWTLLRCETVRECPTYSCYVDVSCV